MRGVGVKEQDKKTRLRGIDAQKANIAAATCVSRVLRSSLGPKGLDKMLQSHDGDVCISKPLLLADSRRVSAGVSLALAHRLMTLLLLQYSACQPTGQVCVHCGMLRGCIRVVHFRVRRECEE